MDEKGVVGFRRTRIAPRPTHPGWLSWAENRPRERHKKQLHTADQMFVVVLALSSLIIKDDRALQLGP